jgi:hypothetical protein
MEVCKTKEPESKSTIKTIEVLNSTATTTKPEEKLFTRELKLSTILLGSQPKKILGDIEPMRPHGQKLLEAYEKSKGQTKKDSLQSLPTGQDCLINAIDTVEQNQSRTSSRKKVGLKTILTNGVICQFYKVKVSWNTLILSYNTNSLDRFVALSLFFSWRRSSFLASLLGELKFPPPFFSTKNNKEQSMSERIDRETLLKCFDFLDKLSFIKHNETEIDLLRFNFGFTDKKARKVYDKFLKGEDYV